MSSTIAMPMDTSPGKNTTGSDMEAFKSFSDNELDTKRSTDDSSEGGDEPVTTAAKVPADTDKHSGTNGHSPVKKVAETPVEEKEKASPVKKLDLVEIETEKEGKVEKQREEEETAKEEDPKVKVPIDEADGDDKEKDKDETVEEVKEEEAEAQPVEKKVKAVKAKAKTPKPKVVKEPTVRSSAPRERKPKLNSDAAIGELDNSLAEQVKSDGLRRERKQIERFVAVAAPARETKAGVVEEGRGTKLGDMEYTAAMINSKKTADLTTLHRVCFSRKGTTHEIKRNLKSFSGFPFEAGSKEIISRKTSMSKWNVKLLGECCSVLGIKKPGTRDLMVDAILEFCLKPDESLVERKTPSSGKSKRKSSSSRGGRKSKSPAKKGSAKSKGKGKKAVKRKMSSEAEEESGHEESEPEEKEDTEEEEEVVAPPKKKQKVEKPQKQLPPAKSPSRALPSRNTKGKKYAFDDEDEVDDDELGYRSEEEKKKSSKKRSHEEAKKKKLAAADSDFEKEGDDSEVEKKKSKKSQAKPAEKKKASKSSSFKPPKKVEAIEGDEEAEEVAPKKKPMAAAEDEGVGSDDEIPPKTSEFPTDSELRKVVSETVKASDLKEVTMKMMLSTIYSKFPGVDLASKKDFLKAAVKDLL